MDEMSSYFEHLMCEDIDNCDDDDDLNGNRRKSKVKDHMTEIPEIYIRTRHKAKARNADYPSKKYERRCFELPWKDL